MRYNYKFTTRLFSPARLTLSSFIISISSIFSSIGSISNPPITISSPTDFDFYQIVEYINYLFQSLIYEFFKFFQNFHYSKLNLNILKYIDLIGSAGIDLDLTFIESDTPVYMKLLISIVVSIVYYLKNCLDCTHIVKLSFCIWAYILGTSSSMSFDPNKIFTQILEQIKQKPVLFIFNIFSKLSVFKFVFLVSGITYLLSLGIIQDFYNKLIISVPSLDLGKHWKSLTEWLYKGLDNTLKYIVGSIGPEPFRLFTKSVITFISMIPIAKIFGVVFMIISAFFTGYLNKIITSDSGTGFGLGMDIPTSYSANPFKITSPWEIFSICSIEVLYIINKVLSQFIGDDISLKSSLIILGLHFYVLKIIYFLKFLPNIALVNNLKLCIYYLIVLSTSITLAMFNPYICGIYFVSSLIFPVICHILQTRGVVQQNNQRVIFMPINYFLPFSDPKLRPYENPTRPIVPIALTFEPVYKTNMEIFKYFYLFVTILNFLFFFNTLQPLKWIPEYLMFIGLLYVILYRVLKAYNNRLEKLEEQERLARAGNNQNQTSIFTICKDLMDPLIYNTVFKPTLNFIYLLDAIMDLCNMLLWIPILLHFVELFKYIVRSVSIIIVSSSTTLCYHLDIPNPIAHISTGIDTDIRSGIDSIISSFLGNGISFVITGLVIIIGINTILSAGISAIVYSVWYTALGIFTVIKSIIIKTFYLIITSSPVLALLRFLGVSTTEFSEILEEIIMNLDNTLIAIWKFLKGMSIFQDLIKSLMLPFKQYFKSLLKNPEIKYIYAFLVNLVSSYIEHFIYLYYSFYSFYILSKQNAIYISTMFNPSGYIVSLNSMSEILKVPLPGTDPGHIYLRDLKYGKSESFYFIKPQSLVIDPQKVQDTMHDLILLYGIDPNKSIVDLVYARQTTAKFGKFNLRKNLNKDELTNLILYKIDKVKPQEYPTIFFTLLNYEQEGDVIFKTLEYIVYKIGNLDSSEYPSEYKTKLRFQILETILNNNKFESISQDSGISGKYTDDNSKSIDSKNLNFIDSKVISNISSSELLLYQAYLCLQDPLLSNQNYTVLDQKETTYYIGLQKDLSKPVCVYIPEANKAIVRLPYTLENKYLIYQDLISYKVINLQLLKHPYKSIEFDIYYLTDSDPYNIGNEQIYNIMCDIRQDFTKVVLKRHLESINSYSRELSKAMLETRSELLDLELSLGNNTDSYKLTNSIKSLQNKYDKLTQTISKIPELIISKDFKDYQECLEACKNLDTIFTKLVKDVYNLDYEWYSFNSNLIKYLKPEITKLFSNSIMGNIYYLWIRIFFSVRNLLNLYKSLNIGNISRLDQSIQNLYSVLYDKLAKIPRLRYRINTNSYINLAILNTHSETTQSLSYEYLHYKQDNKFKRNITELISYFYNLSNIGL
jgi:hypothetical protein